MALSFCNPLKRGGNSIALPFTHSTFIMISNTKSYGKSYNVGLHFDNYPNKKQQGRVKISLVVNLSGKKEYYPILPAPFMFRKYWKEAIDPQSGQKLGHNFIQSRGNRDYEAVFPIVAEAKAEMEALIRKLLRKKETLTHTILRRRWNRESDILHEYLLKYIHDEVRRLEPATQQNYLKVAAKVKAYDPGIKLAEVSWEWFRDFQNWMLSDYWNQRKGRYGLDRNTSAKYLRILGTVFRWAQRQGDIEEDPYYQYKGLRTKVKYRTATPNPLTIAEVLRLDKAYHTGELRGLRLPMKDGRLYNVGDTWHRYLQLIMVSLYSGVRYSDLKRFENPKHFKLIANSTGTHIHFKMKKSKKDHAILITERLRSVLAERKDGRILLGEVPANNTVNRKLKQILAHLGLDADHKWHDLRATFANLIRDLSEDEFGASKALGHSNLAITQAHYFDSSNPQADKAVAALDKLGKSDSDFPDPEDFIYELQLLKMLNPGVRLTPKMKQWLEKREQDEEQAEETLVVPFGVAK